jgi:hypothetical protein
MEVILYKTIPGVAHGDFGLILLNQIILLAKSAWHAANERQMMHAANERQMMHAANERQMNGK